MNNFKADILFQSDARTKIIEGVETLANAVSVTLGPKGKNVAIAYPGQRPHLTKDGVTVANSINLKDPYKNLGCQIVKEAAQRSAEVAGDGTTTSTVLAAALLRDGHRLLETGHDSKEVIRGIETACTQVLQELDATKTAIEEEHQLRSVATISANGEQEIGEIIAKAIETVGADGPISVEDARGFRTSLEIVEGTVVDRGYLSPYFVTDQDRAICELSNPLVFIYNQTLSTAKTILPVLEKAAALNRPLLIIANDVTSEALKTLVLNKMKGAISVCALKAPEFGAARTQALQDLAVVCDAEVVAVDMDSDEDLDKILGNAEKVVVSKVATMFIGTSGDKQKISDRIKSCTNKLETEVLSASDTNLLKRRARRMSEGVAIIRVGGATEIEMYERKDRIDDALCASRAAKKSGIQPGGGVALVYAAKRATKQKPRGTTESFSAGFDAFIKACQSPLRQIVANTGDVPEIVMRKIQRSSPASNLGYDAETGTFGEMLEMNIVDPHEVVVSSLSHATSVASNILSIGCAISLEETEEGKLGLIEEL